MQELKTGERIDIIYRPNLNEWQGEVSLQLVVEVIRKSADVSGHG
jgi:predicted component of type VI protein secretion system